MGDPRIFRSDKDVFRTRGFWFSPCQFRIGAATVNERNTTLAIEGSKVMIVGLDAARGISKPWIAEGPCLIAG